MTKERLQHSKDLVKLVGSDHKAFHEDTFKHQRGDEDDVNVSMRTAQMTSSTVSPFTPSLVLLSLFFVHLLSWCVLKLLLCVLDIFT